MDNYKLISHFKEVEKVGLDIQRKRKDIVAFDSQRQSNREAVRALAKSDENTVWCCVGSTFLKLSVNNVSGRLKDDVRKLDLQIKTINDELKKDVNSLNDLENKEPLKGFDLEAVNKTV